MAVLKRAKEEEEGSQVSEYIPRILLRGQLLPGHRVSGRPFLFLLRGLPGRHPHTAPHRVRQLEQRRVGSRNDGESTGLLETSKIYNSNVDQRVVSEGEVK